MKAIILEENQRGYFTNMKDIFNAIDNQQKKYNWLISDYECNIYPSATIPMGKSFVWIDGDRLTELVEKEDIQFIWGVFSAFSKELSLEQIMQYDIPIANGNRNIWTKEFKIQNPLADIEIISWDSTLVVLISKLDEIVDKFVKMYPKSIDLLEYNTK